MFGFAPKKINLTGSNYSSCGYYLYVCNGTLYAQTGESNSTYSNNFAFTSGSLIGAKWDKKKGTITFYSQGMIIH
jgi:hypothetical protein